MALGYGELDRGLLRGRGLTASDAPVEAGDGDERHARQKGSADRRRDLRAGEPEDAHAGQAKHDARNPGVGEDTTPAHEGRASHQRKDSGQPHRQRGDPAVEPGAAVKVVVEPAHLIEPRPELAFRALLHGVRSPRRLMS